MYINMARASVIAIIIIVDSLANRLEEKLTTTQLAKKEYMAASFPFFSKVAGDYNGII